MEANVKPSTSNFHSSAKPAIASMPVNPQSISIPWMYLWAGIFSIGWLLPKPHTLWFSFQTEVWVAVASLLAAAILLCKYWNRHLPVPMIAVALATLSLVPAIQWAFGLIALGGHAWLCSLYLFGFALALGCGFAWEKAWPGQCTDALFFSIGLAALVTVFLQATQWCGLADGSTWWVVPAPPTRPNGNFGQANLAATFLLWGLCAVAWFTARHRLHYLAAIAMAALMLFGIALSNSRTAFLGLILCIAIVFLHRRLWGTKAVLQVVSGLAAFFLACVFFIPWIKQQSNSQKWVSQSEIENTVFNSSSLSERLDIWSIALEAIKERPRLGYGWGQTFTAQLEVADRPHGFGQPLTSAHNLALDLMLWVGMPIGLLLLAGVGLWLYRRRTMLGAPDTFIVGLFIVIFCNHAMLELPFQYAYMLLPFGWVVGALEARVGQGDVCVFKAPWTLTLLAVGFMALCLYTIEMDYLVIDEAHSNRVLKRLHLTGNSPAEPTPGLLTHLAGQVGLEQFDIGEKDKGLETLKEMEDLAMFAPGPFPMILVPGTLVVNGQPERARWWLRRICKIRPAHICRKLQLNWQALGEKHPAIAAVAWPENTVDTKAN